MQCSYCDADSRDFFLWWPVSEPRHCAVCGNEKKLCYHHRNVAINYNLSQSGYGLKYTLCRDCIDWRNKVVAEVIAVRSGHIGNHKTINVIGHGQTRFQQKDIDDSVWEIKYNAALLGANAVLNLKHISHKNHDGNFIYKLWTVSGDYAIVKRND